MIKKIRARKRIKRGGYFSYRYLSLSAYLESLNLKGFTNWMRIVKNTEVRRLWRS
jgi:ferritin